MDKIINEKNYIFAEYFFSESLLIRAIRKLNNLSQKDFCLLFNCTQSALSKIENGFISPDLKLIVNLAQHLNLDLNVFKYGHIPQVSKALLTNIISPAYTENGLFSSKTVYVAMEIIKIHFNKHIYKELGIRPELFCFSFIKFNIMFLNKVFTDISTENFNKICAFYKSNEMTGTSSQEIYSHIINNKFIDLVKITKDSKFNVYRLKINHKYFQSILEYEESLYIIFFYLDLKLLFGNCVHEILKVKNEYRLGVYFAA